MFQKIGLLLVVSATLVCGFAPMRNAFRSVHHKSSQLSMQGDGLKIDMRGKTVFVAGVSDSTGYGWAIAKACAEAGAKIVLGTWPPVLPMFLMNMDRPEFDDAKKLSDGSMMEIAKVSICSDFFV